MADNNGDRRDRNSTALEAKRTRQWLPLVKKIAAARARNSPEQFDDLYQEGCVGLIKAIRSYRPEKGVFEPWARTCINGEINHYLRENWGTTVPCKPWVRDLWNSAKRAQELIQQSGREVSIDEVARQCGICEKTWAVVKNEINGVKILSLDTLDRLD